MFISVHLWFQLPLAKRWEIATVCVVDNPQFSSSEIELAPGISVPVEAVRFQYSRSSGPGGQNVNKVNTRAELWIALESLNILPGYALARLRTIAGKRVTRDGELHLVAQVERSQEGNRQAVLDRLRDLIRQALEAPRPRRATRPSKASRRRRLEGKRIRSEIKSNRRDVTE